MKRKLMTAMALAFCGAALTLAADGSWTGYISCSHCGAKEGHADCATKCVKEHSSSYVFVSDADHKVYAIDNQDKAAPHAGHHVTVKGTADGDNLKIASIDMAK